MAPPAGLDSDLGGALTPESLVQPDCIEGEESELEHDVHRYTHRRACEAAIGSLSEALLQEPSDLRLLRMRAELYVELDYLRAAEHDFERAVILAPKNASLWRDLAKVRLRLSLYATALEALQRAHALDPEDLDLQLLLARCYRRLGSLRVALKHYVKTLDGRDSPSVELLVEAASLVPRIEPTPAEATLRRAHEWIESAVERDPENSTAWYVCGLLCERVEGSDAAIAYERCLEVSPDHHAAWTNLAFVRRGRGDQAGYQLAVQRAASLEPDRNRRRALERLSRKE